MSEERNISEPLEQAAWEQRDVSDDSAQSDILELRQYCVFRAGRERFCLSVLEVEEVVDWPEVTRMPRAPGFLIGIFNLRGAIVPIVDIAMTEVRRADMPPRHVVVACLSEDELRDEMRVGIAADEVFGTFSTSEPLILTDAPRDIPHCCGMLRHENRLALTLDLKRLVEVFPVPVI